MSEEDLKTLLETIERLDQEITTPEQAQAMLRSEGFLDENNEIAEPYIQATA